MPSLVDLENEYTEMKLRNMGERPSVLSDTSGVCLAISTMGRWQLNHRTWSRLMRWLDPIRGKITLLTPTGEEGMLHWTLQQCNHFSDQRYSAKHEGLSALHHIIGDLNGIVINYRGITMTRAGVALCGYPENEEQYTRIQQVRQRLPAAFAEMGVPYKPPYLNTICHATLFRWKIAPTKEELLHVIKGVPQWVEADFGVLKPHKWVLGHYDLLLKQVEVITTIHTPSIISHRGLLYGPNHLTENRPEVFDARIEGGIVCECDVWFEDDKFYLGHDGPVKEISWSWLRSRAPYLLIHAKSPVTFHRLNTMNNSTGADMNIFYHTNEDLVLTTRGDVIVYPGQPVLDGWVSMMPEIAPDVKNSDAGLICSDYLYNLSKIYRD